MARPTLRQDARGAAIRWYFEGVHSPPPRDGFGNVNATANDDDPASRFVFPPLEFGAAEMWSLGPKIILFVLYVQTVCLLAT